MTECDHADVRAVANPRYILRCEACGAEVFEDLAFGGYTSADDWPKAARAEEQMLAELDAMQSAYGFTCEVDGNRLVMRGTVPPRS